jgi:hypothetical protein
MTKLWTLDDAGAWEAALARYEEVVEAQGVARLAELDRWYRDELPGRSDRSSRTAITRLNRLTHSLSLPA